MKAVSEIRSRTVVLPAENVDTDQIVPARYLKVTDKLGLAEALFRDWRFEEERVDAICERAAAAFWNEHKTPDSVVRALFAALAAFEGVGHKTDSHAGRLVRALVLTADNPRPLIEQLVTHEAGWRLLRPALIAAQERDQALAQALASELSLSEREEIRAAAITPLLAFCGAKVTGGRRGYLPSPPSKWMAFLPT